MELVFVGKLIKISKIENLDFLSEATVICGSGKSWVGVVKTSHLTVGIFVRVFLPNAFLSRDNNDFAIIQEIPSI